MALTTEQKRRARAKLAERRQVAAWRITDNAITQAIAAGDLLVADCGPASDTPSSSSSSSDAGGSGGDTGGSSS